MVNGGNKDDMMSRRSTGSTSTPVSASAINYPDNQQVFVGNLPQHLTDQDLIDFFERMCCQFTDDYKYRSYNMARLHAMHNVIYTIASSYLLCTGVRLGCITKKNGVIKSSAWFFKDASNPNDDGDW